MRRNRSITHSLLIWRHSRLRVDTTVCGTCILIHSAHGSYIHVRVTGWHWEISDPTMALINSRAE